MNDNDLLEWLYESSGPVIRLRMYRELDYRTDKEETLIDSVTTLPETIFLTEQLKASHEIHGSQCSRFENIAGKFYEFGLTGYTRLFDSHICRWLDKARELRECRDFFCDYTRTMLLFCLKVLGYDTADIDILCRIRLDNIFRFCSDKNYDIYLTENPYGDLPQSRAGKPLVRPDIYQNGAVGLPSVYDLLWFPYYYNTHHEKIDTVMRYVFSEEYHKSERGYGNIREGHRHYYSMGWSMHLPGFPDPKMIEKFDNGRELLLYLDRLVHFPLITESKWFGEIWTYLNGFRTDRGTWRFPAAWMKEYGNKGGYYCLGYHMGLGEDRKNREFIELESTFRMLKFKKEIEKNDRK